MDIKDMVKVNELFADTNFKKERINKTEFKNYYPSPTRLN